MRPGTRWCWLCMGGFLWAHHCDCKFSCAAGVGRIQMSLECLSSEHDGVVVRGVAAWLGSCFGSCTDTVLQNDIWGRDLSPNASQSHQVLESAQINGAESWLCRAVHHVCLTACCSPCLSMIHPPISYPSMEKSRKWQTPSARRTPMVYPQT